MRFISVFLLASFGLAPVAGFAQSLPASVLAQKERGECDAVRDYLTANGIGLFQYRSCVAKHRPKYIAQALERSDCEAIEALIVKDEGLGALFECSANVAAHTQNFNIHLRSYFGQRELRNAKAITNETFIERVKLIHLKAQQTGDAGLIEHSLRYMKDYVGSGEAQIALVQKKRSREIRKIVDAARQQSVRDAAARLRRAWGHSSTSEEVNMDGTSATRSIIRMDFSGTKNAREICTATLREELTTRFTKDDRVFVTRKSAWTIDFVVYGRHTINDSLLFAFSRIFPDRLIFGHENGISIAECEDWNLVDGVSETPHCEMPPMISIDPDTYDALRDSVVDLMIACYETYGKG